MHCDAACTNFAAPIGLCIDAQVTAVMQRKRQKALLQEESVLPHCNFFRDDQVKTKHK